jgi:hypothetical protein
MDQDDGILLMLELVYLLRDWRNQLTITLAPAKVVEFPVQTADFLFQVRAQFSTPLQLQHEAYAL